MFHAAVIAETLALKDEDVEKAALAKQNGDYAEYERLLNAVAGKGFDPADVKKAVESCLLRMETTMEIQLVQIQQKII